jgi:transposase
MSIITNRGPTHGWSLKNSICEINIPFIKPNVRYSLLMASSNIKIIKYKLVKGSIKSDDFINFIIELNKENPNYNFLIDNASIHKSKKANNIYKEKKINIIYNAPYQSEFNPIEMIFSLLRKKLNKKIVKNEESILEVIKELEKNIKKEELENIFRHCEKRLKEILKI